jgi:sugar phosphate isomerase/epimerase
MAENRRDFLKKGALLTAGAITAPTIFSACSKAVEQKKFGVQIYSVRNQLQEDFEGTINALAEIGFSYIEGYGLGLDGNILGRTPEEFKAITDQAGLDIVSCHSTWFTAEEAPVMVEASQKLGLKYNVIPYLSQDNRKDYDQKADTLNEVGSLFSEAGIGFGYHNHDFEFFELEDGRIPMEILIEGTDPALVDFEADLYWVAKAGFKPMELIQKYPGRFKMFHVKDADENLDQTTVGTGIIDFQTILSNKEQAGLEYYFVEDERTGTPLENLKGAFGYLQSI